MARIDKINVNNVLYDVGKELVQVPGTGTNSTMSQKAITDYVNASVNTGTGQAGQTFTGNAEFNLFNNVLKMNGLKDALDLEVGDVIQFSNTVKNNKTHTVESFITADTELDGNITGPNQTWVGFVSVTGKFEDIIALGFNSKLHKLVEGKWTEIPSSVARRWTGVTKLDNGRVFACTAREGIYEIFANGTDNKVTVTAHNWFAITSTGNIVYAAVYGDYVYKLDLLNSSAAERDKIGLPVNTAARTQYSGIIIDGNYLYHTGDQTGIYRKNLTDTTPCVRVDTPAVAHWRSNFINYKGNIYSVGHNNYTCILDRASNTFTPTDPLIDIQSLHCLGANVIEGHIIIGDGAGNYNIPGTNVYIKSPVKAGDIILNYEHAATRGRGPLKLSNETKTGVNVKLLSKWYNAPIGLGQAWTDVGLYRGLDVLYVNSTNRMIECAEVSEYFGYGDPLTVSIDGVNILITDQGNGVGWLGPVSFTVPPQSNYMLTKPIHSNIQSWHELR